VTFSAPFFPPQLLLCEVPCDFPLLFKLSHPLIDVSTRVLCPRPLSTNLHFRQVTETCPIESRFGPVLFFFPFCVLVGAICRHRAGRSFLHCLFSLPHPPPPPPENPGIRSFFSPFPPVVHSLICVLRFWFFTDIPPLSRLFGVCFCSTYFLIFGTSSLHARSGDLRSIFVIVLYAASDFFFSSFFAGSATERVVGDPNSSAFPLSFFPHEPFATQTELPFFPFFLLGGPSYSFFSTFTPFD